MYISCLFTLYNTCMSLIISVFCVQTLMNHKYLSAGTCFCYYVVCIIMSGNMTTTTTLVQALLKFYNGTFIKLTMD